MIFLIIIFVYIYLQRYKYKYIKKILFIFISGLVRWPGSPRAALTLRRKHWRNIPTILADTSRAALPEGNWWAKAQYKLGFQFHGFRAQYGRLRHGVGGKFGSNFPRTDNPAFLSGVAWGVISQVPQVLGTSWLL